MDLTFSPEEEAFRTEVRTFIARKSAAGSKGQGPARHDNQGGFPRLAPHPLPSRAGSRRRGPRNMAAPAGTSTQRYIFNEERPRRHTPDPAVRHRMVRPGDLHLRHRGAEDSASCRASSPAKTGGARAIPSRAPVPILPALKTRAVRDGDHYIVNGQKTWTTLAQLADWIFCLVRTDTDVQDAGRHHLPAHRHEDARASPCSPIIMLDGAHEVNEVFFDNVNVPVENRIGEENKGWTYAKFLLAHERSGIAGVARSKAARSSACSEIARTETVDGAPLIGDRRILARKVAELEIDLAGARIHRAAHAGGEGRGQVRRARKPRSSRSRAPRSSSA